MMGDHSEQGFTAIQINERIPEIIQNVTILECNAYLLEKNYILPPILWLNVNFLDKPLASDTQHYL